MANSEVKRIAMWSGPRNISTAMMRAWENRDDTAVSDEPFYACYLARAGVIHPMQEEIFAAQSSDWNEVIANELHKPLAEGEQVHYQKHMTHHMIEEVDPLWFASVQNAFLIRHPAEVVRSYAEKMETITATDIGYANQTRLYDNACAVSDSRVPVMDAKDVLLDPIRALSLLCEALGVRFDQNMLSWPTGYRDSDGVWASHWYNKVITTTGFATWKEKRGELSEQQQAVVEESMPHYEQLYANRITLD